jgi:WD40 repeat protein
MLTWDPRANDLFLKALELQSASERQAYLDGACRGDAARRAEVEALLDASARAGSFLESPASALRVTLDLPSDGEDSRTVIGPYKLLEQIGEGGMGTVWMAQQTEPVKRLVAVKLIKAGMDSRQVIARFEAERQALALMDHANIARVLDAGTTSADRPYFVMDLVKGVPITRYCDEHHLTLRQRLELFIPVCQAIQHAHQKGIIHRDLKPSNVLIALYDGKPVPKVIDFGVAKAAGQSLTEKTLVTGFGALVGTLEYMSPEQAERNQLDIDTRSDIYSLGVLLYELLTGSPPFSRKQLEQAGVFEMLRVIREKEPTKPSTKLSTAEGLPALAANRGTEPARLKKLVRGELDWIVMKALEKDRNRRYETANSFASDLQRYLHDEPVHACPPSAGYRLRKFAQRNKRALALASLLSVILLLAVSALAGSYVRTNAALGRETRAREGLREALQREQETSYLQRIALAGRELGAGNIGRAEVLLDDCPAHLRGWEWRFLKRLRYGGARLIEHQATVLDVAFSPDGRQIATACLDGALTIWDARTGQKLQPLERRTAPVGGADGAFVRGMAYSKDGRYLAVARNDGRVRVWDLSRERQLYTLEAHCAATATNTIPRAWQVAFSPDSRILASCGSDRKVRLWDLASGQFLQEFSEHPGQVRGLAFRPDGRIVVAACDEGTVKVWDRDTRQAVFSFQGEEAADPVWLSFSPDARRVGWCCFDGVIKVWDTTTGRLEINQPSNTFRCRNVNFSPDGGRIAVAGFDGTIRLLDAVSGREMLTIFAHSSYVVSAVFSPNSQQLASASFDQTVRLWDATPLTSDPLAPHCVTLSEREKEVSGVAFSPDGRWLASASWDHNVKVWETGTMTHRYTLRGHSGIVWAVAFSPDSRTLASVSFDESVKLWDLEAPTGDSLQEIHSIAFDQRVLSIDFSPDGRLLAIGEYDGIALYDPRTANMVHRLKKTFTPVPSVAFHPNRPLLLSSGASDPAIKIWDVAAEQFSFEIRQKANPSPNVAVSHDGRRIASPLTDVGPGDHSVMVWDVDWDAKTYRTFRRLKGHQAYVWRVAFSPDGRYLASGSWDSMIKIWDLQAPESAEPVTLRGHAGFILGLAFSPDGRRLASASGYAGRGEIKVWDATLWTDKSRGAR